MTSPMPVSAYPAARRLDLVERLPEASPTHEVADPYRWLEDAASPESQEWAQAQRELCSAFLDGLPGRKELQDQLRELLAAGHVSAPAWRRDRRFFMRRRGDQEHAVVVTAIGGNGSDGGSETDLIDPIAIDPSGTTTLDAWQPSKEGHRLAYQLSEGGDEESVLRIIDVESGALLDGPIDRCRYSPVAWLPGGEAFYYVRRLAPGQVPVGEEQYHRRVWLHRVGTDTADDVMVFGDGHDKTSFYGVSVSLDGRWMIVSQSIGTAPRNDVWLADLQASSPEAPRLVPAQVDVDAQTAAFIGRDGRLYLLTDRDAPRGRLAVVDPDAVIAGRGEWHDLIPQDAEAVLEDVAILDGDELATPLLLASWTLHAVSSVSVHDLSDGARTGEVTLPGLGSLGGLSVRPEGGHECWFGYTDHTTPPAVYHFDAHTGETSLWALPPGAGKAGASTPAASEVHTRQVTYTSRDGTPVRMFIISPTAEPDVPRPTILYGYGGFGASLTPGYSATALAWVAAGGVYAIANLRGGGEEGESWHRDGMREKKQNVFDDFHAAADLLVEQKWTTHEQLGISGGSNGGLLVGAALTQHPEKYAAVVCSAPLLDMVRYEQFGLGQVWSEEYGTASDPDELTWLLAYSPYHHVRNGVAYPAVLFTVFDSDTRVDPLHARKMCAALQAATTSGRPVLLRAESDVGHGARALSRSIDLSADTLAFLAAGTGLTLG